jgi:carboxypeptidase T
MKYVLSIFPSSQRNTNPELQRDVAYPDSTNGIFIDIHSYSEIITWPWVYSNIASPNNEGLGSLANKFDNFNGHSFSGPGDSYLYQASGIAVDWAYTTTGAAAFSFEIGDTFHQDCTYFQNKIVKQNFSTLMYAAKVASAPYSLPKGPNVISIAFSATLVKSNRTTKARPTVSDSAWSAQNYTTSQQRISSISAWVDVHPSDSVAGTGIRVAVPSSNASMTTTGTYIINASLYSIGRHILYFQGTDTSECKEPISAAYFYSIASNVTVTKSPTKAVTKAPTKVPTTVPTDSATSLPI